MEQFYALFLGDYAILFELGMRCKRLQDEIDANMSMALPQGIDYSSMRGAGSAPLDAFERKAIRFIEMVEDYVAELDAYVEEQHDAHERIARVQGERCRIVLTEYYLLAKSWPEVAEATGYSTQHCRKIRDESLCMAYDVMPHEFRSARHPAV